MTNCRNRRVATGLAAALLASTWMFLAPAPAEPTTSSESRMASEVIGQINNERAERGLSRLSVNGTLAADAQRIAEGNRNSGCHACHSGSPGNGEVVHWSEGPGASGRATVAWMVSTVHRNILMSPGVTAIGVGLACYPDGGIEAVGRVLGATSTGAPLSPVVTSSKDGSSCSPGTTTTKAPPAPTAAPAGDADGGSGDNGQNTGSTDDGSGTPAAPASGQAAPAASATPTTAKAANGAVKPTGGGGTPRRPAASGTAAPAGGGDYVPPPDEPECSTAGARFQSFGRRCVRPGSGSFRVSALDFTVPTTTPSTTAAPLAGAALDNEAVALSGADDPRTQGLMIACGAVAAISLVALWRSRNRSRLM